MRSSSVPARLTAAILTFGLVGLAAPVRGHEGGDVASGTQALVPPVAALLPALVGVGLIRRRTARSDRPS